MDAIGLLIIFSAVVFCLYRADFHKKRANELKLEIDKLFSENQFLNKKYGNIEDAEECAAKILEDANKLADEIVNNANIKDHDAEQRKVEAQNILAQAAIQANDIVGDAIKTKENAELYEKTAIAMKNIIKGYGNEYILPSHLLLDDIAETYGYTQAGEDLKSARKNSKEIVKSETAAICDYVEASRSNTAINFVIDAFNGKVDSILSRAKVDNYGKLKQEMIDAFNLVNYNGQSFRNARITEKYFSSRAEELRLACLVYEIRQQDIEEQRRIKEQIREEEKARREIEKALRDSAKEEEMLQKAMEKVRAQLNEANEGQRAKYEAQIAELEQKWKEAEERNQRAISMAQQTKSGHVYIISNVGSFGENIYKIGMTRRLEPLDRIRELGDASVPFAFDVHAMIWSKDAPALESELHKRFAISQLNKVNYRKEFFKTTLQGIRESIEKEHNDIKWTMTAEAREYRESVVIDEKLKDNPEAQKAWLERQFALEAREPVEVFSNDDDENDA